MTGGAGLTGESRPATTRGASLSQQPDARRTCKSVEPGSGAEARCTDARSVASGCLGLDTRGARYAALRENALTSALSHRLDTRSRSAARRPDTVAVGSSTGDPDAVTVGRSAVEPRAVRSSRSHTSDP